MAADPIIYCLENVTDYAQFESMCHDVMMNAGFCGIEPLGGMHDKGRDAIHRARDDSGITVFAYSVREDWKAKLRADAQVIRKHEHACGALYFITTASIDARARDEMVVEIENSYGWKLEIFGQERLRLEIAPRIETFSAQHPQIFTPALFPTSANEFDLSIHVCPTRNKRTQLAQIVLFNRGAKPIFVESWYAVWGGQPDTPSTGSWDCWQGTLPARLEVQSRYELLVVLDRAPIDTLTQIGVRDGNGKIWGATPDEVRAFVTTAKQHEPPPAKPRFSEDVLKACEVEIDVAAVKDASHVSPVLEAVFRNKSTTTIEITGAEVSWRYDPPERMGSDLTKKGPRVEEVSSSLSLRPLGHPLVEPGQSTRFCLPRDMAGALIRTLKPNVPSSSIEVTIGTPTRIAWSATGDDVAKAVRDVAQGTLDEWDHSPTSSSR